MARQKICHFSGVGPRIGLCRHDGNRAEHLAVGLNQAVKILRGFFTGGGNVGFHIGGQHLAHLFPIERHARGDQPRRKQKKENKGTKFNPLHVLLPRVVENGVFIIPFILPFYVQDTRIFQPKIL